MNRSAEDFESARLDRVTDEELLAEAVVEAVELVFNPDVARANPDAAIAWVEAEGDRLTALAVAKPGSMRRSRGRIGWRRCGGTRSVGAATV